MKNFIFISPNFPTNYWKFCAELKKNGMNVLGIGDCPYDQLMPELRGSLNEYYKVSSLENYDEVFRAVAFLTYKHGKIDWLESNNEYWLERDAMLRTAFNITTGFHTEDMQPVKYKSAMKANYAKAGVKTARWHIVRDYTGCKDFIGEVMNWTYQVAGNSSDFVSDESHDYSVVLVPHTCVNPEYTTQQIEADCENYGYELYHCNLCGYEYKDNYTARKHEVEQWRTIREADIENNGIVEGECVLCGAAVRELTDKLEVETTTESEAQTTETEVMTAEEKSQNAAPDNAYSGDGIRDDKDFGGVTIMAVIIAAIVITAVGIIKKTRRK